MNTSTRTARGDHVCYINNLTRFKSHYPKWEKIVRGELGGDIRIKHVPTDDLPSCHVSSKRIALPRDPYDPRSGARPEERVRRGSDPKLHGESLVFQHQDDAADQSNLKKRSSSVAATA